MSTPDPSAAIDIPVHRAPRLSTVALLAGVALCILIGSQQNNSGPTVLAATGCYITGGTIAWSTTRRYQLPGLGLLLVGFWTGFYGLVLIVPTDTRHGTSAPLYSRVSSDWLNHWSVLAGFALLVIAIGHRAATLAYQPTATLAYQPTADPGRSVDLPSPWLLTLIAVPVLGLLMSRGSTHDTRGYTQAGLASQFAPQLVALAAISWGLKRQKTRVVSLILACLGVALVGQRLEILVAALTVVGGWRWLGVGLSRRQIGSITIAVLGLLLALTAARSVVGRQDLQGEAATSTRLKGLGDGLAGLSGSGLLEQSAVQARARFEGNAFPALILQTQSRDRWRSGLTPYVNGVRLAIPSFLWPSKTDQPLETRAEKAFLVRGYHLPIYTDFLPTWGGSMLASFGPVGLIGLAALIGFIAGMADAAMRIRSTPRLLIGVTAASTIGFFERTLSDAIVATRGLILLTVCVVVLRRGERFMRGHHLLK